MDLALDFNNLDIAAHTGYGRAGRELKEALIEADVEVLDKAQTCLNFCMPPNYKYKKKTIGYTPWESTQIPESWLVGLNRVDDLWATSSWVASLFEKVTDRNVFVLPHGISESWTPIRHYGNNRPFTFLHVGEPALRKGGDILLEVWQKVFANNKHVKLLYKCQKYTVARVKDAYGSLIASPASMNNVQVIDTTFCDAEMWKLYALSDCMVYPSRGEGFGLIPFEAMATGLPTILPLFGGTSEFAHFGYPISNSRWVKSDANEHPGLWMDHDRDELADLMLHIYTNYDRYSGQAYKNAVLLHSEYSWKKIAQMAIERIVNM